MEFFFDKPTQVRFWEDLEDGEKVKHYGIAYHDEIICGCCGGVVEAENVVAIDELEWTPIEEFIEGT